MNQGMNGNLMMWGMGFGGLLSVYSSSFAWPRWSNTVFQQVEEVVERAIISKQNVDTVFAAACARGFNARMLWYSFQGTKLSRT